MARVTKADGRVVSLVEGNDIAVAFISQLTTHGLIEQATIAGSLRRERPTANDIDIVVILRDPGQMPERPADMKARDWDLVRPRLPHERVKMMLDSSGGGPSKVWGLFQGVYVDVMFATYSSWGAALMHTTGPKEINVSQRARALSMGMRLSEHGLFRLDDNSYVAGEHERDVYAALKLNFVMPRDRF